ncbi:MAG: hypothetical protein JOZ19_00420 [Rubrobacter sp.]|nr:hypothetical protein [Rubrobacter sp.]
MLQRSLACTQALRYRGPHHREIVGEFLGLDTDKGIHCFFRHHYGEWFPALKEVHRTTFARQAANLWKVKERLWQEFLALAPHEPSFLAICDSMPLPTCLFRGEAAFGKDTLLKQTFYSFYSIRVHVRMCWPGVISRLSVVPADAHELFRTLPETGRAHLQDPHRGAQLPLAKDERGVGEHGHRTARALLFQEVGSHFRTQCLSRFRYRIDTVIPQLTGRYCVKRVWAKDLWHLTSRLLRKVFLSHTLAFLLDHRADNQPLQLVKLLH